MFSPAYLELREADTDAAGLARYDVSWKVPAQGELRIALSVRLPPDTIEVRAPDGLFSDAAYVGAGESRETAGSRDRPFRLPLEGGATEVIARIEREDGSSRGEHLLPERTSLTVIAAAGTAEVAWTYMVLGIEHILGGIDYLLFVLALLLIGRGERRILVTTTAFTVAHSITLVRIASINHLLVNRAEYHAREDREHKPPVGEPG